MKKVLILCSSIIPNGGSERAVSNLSELLSEIGDVSHKIISICSDESETPAFNFKGEVLHLSMKHLQTSLIKKIGWYRKILLPLNKIIKDNQPDVIFSIGHNISAIVPFLHTGSARTYACEHIDFNTIPPLNQKILTTLYPRLSGVIVLSDIAKEKLIKTNRNVIVIPNSIPFQINRKSTMDNKSFIMVGRISPEKGYCRLIPIAKRLKALLPNWTINVYGDGPDRIKIEKMIEENELGDFVRLHGTDKHISERYPENDILLLTSYTEALPMAIIEANAFGLPAIAYENEGVNVLLNDGLNGYRIEADNVEKFVEAVKMLTSDKERLLKISDDSEKRSREFLPECVKKKWESLIFG